MTRRDPRFPILVVALALAVVAAACAGSGDTTDDDAPTASTCAEGEPDCGDAIEPDDASLPPNTASPSGSSGMIVDGGITIGEALAYVGDQPVAVRGFVVIDAEGARLCEALAESFPPQCGGAHLDIANPDGLTDITLEEDGSTQWSVAPVTVLGEVDEDLVTIDSLSR